MWPPWQDQGTVGIFWDYENVPLRQKDSSPFLKGLKSFIRQNSVVFARVYSREQTLPFKREKQIRALRPFDIKFTSMRGEDAVDMSLIQSCLRVLDDRRDIDHVLVLTGDIDYREFVIQLKNRKLRVTLICQEGNHSPYLVDDAHRAYSVSFVAEFPHTWWNQAPQAEIAAILDARYTSDSGKIAELVKQLDPAKPFHSVAILAVLESRFDLTADDSAAFEKLKTLVSPALKHFENQVYETRDRQAIARVDRVWEKIRGLDLYHLQLLGTDKLPDAFEKLLPLLEHPDKDYKQTAIRSLGNLGDLRARFPLEDLKTTIMKSIDPRQEQPLKDDDEKTLECIESAHRQLAKKE